MATDVSAHFGQIEILTLLPQHVACSRAVSPSPEEDAVGQMERWLRQQGLEELTRQPNFGMDVEVSPEEARAGLRGYAVWYPVPEGVQATDPITIDDLPGGRYAVMRLTEPFSDPFAIIPAGWQHIVNWGHTNGEYQLASHQSLERFIPNGDSPYLDLYLAVTKAED